MISGTITDASGRTLSGQTTEAFWNSLRVYHLNEGVPTATNTGITSAADASGNNASGTLNNFALSGAASNWVVGTATIPISSPRAVWSMTMLPF